MVEINSMNNLYFDIKNTEKVTSMRGYHSIRYNIYICLYINI